MERFYAITTRRAVVDGAVKPAAIVIDAEKGLITDVKQPENVPKDLEVEDVGDDVVMPGMIDVHVHVNEPGRTHWEGFETATKAACAGGITTIVDMPLNSTPVTTTAEAFREKLHATSEKLFVDCGFYGGLVPGNVEHLPELLDAGVLGIKAFLCHSGIDEFPNATEAELRAVMPLLTKRDIPLLVHAELVDDEAPAIADPRSYEQYAASRPERWEHRAIEGLIDLCRQTGCAVHIVHLAASKALPALREARAEGLPITVETCPHYLYFATEEIPDGDPRYKCAPPIRDAENRRKLRASLKSGGIDLVATDHSPSPPELKNLGIGDIEGAWGGIASLQLMVPALWTSTREQDATVADIARWTSTRPARLLGLDNEIGTISPGKKAHLVVWDPEASFTVDAGKLHHRHPVSPYDGAELYGVVRATYLSGRKVFDGQTVSSTPTGNPILRTTMTGDTP